MPARSKKPVEVPNQVDARLLQAARDIAKLRQDLSNANRLKDEAINQLRTVEAQSNFLDAIMPNGVIGYPDIKPKRITGESTAMLILSDWHWEEKVDPLTINNRNVFNPKIAAKRAKNMFAKAAGIIDLYRGFTTINELVVAVLGDMINGYIHDEFLEGNYMSPSEACLEVMEHLVAGIEMLRKETKAKRITIPTAVGNHGRTTQKKRVATSCANSFEWFMYKVLEMYYKDDPVVRWQVGNGYHNWLDVQGHKVRFHHGDSIRYQGGVGGISIPVNKAIAAWNKSEPAALDIFGHYHQSKEDRWWVSNGSLVGYNAYAVEIKADYEEPSQSLVIMSRTRGKIGNMRVFCE